MYISELKLWNFRKYGKEDWDLDRPHLSITFNEGLNVLIGENDSGKTAILDAIKLVLKTHAYEWIHVQDEDFYNAADKLRIEIEFKGLKEEEAKNFIEWLGWEGDGDAARPILRLIYEVEKRNGRILPADVKAGMDAIGYPLNAEAKEYLKTTYLKALRDADSELVAKKNSRISQILREHNLFKVDESKPHQFEEWFYDVNMKIKEWFEDQNASGDEKSNKEQIKDLIDSYLKDFIEDTHTSKLELASPEIKAILEKISLEIDDKKNLGLGTMNRLYMAAELLHLRKDWNGLKLCLVEELEAHLHPQAQMKVIEALAKEKNVQFILTTHSPNLASKVDVDKLIICHKNEVFPLRESDTKLDPKDYTFLKRFLDVTKSNLFFAKGVIIVEGWAEEILLPVLAKTLGFDLTKYEVSVVNVGSTAYLHFAKIFLRNDSKGFDIPVAVVTDLDIRPDDEDFNTSDEEAKEKKIRDNFKDFEYSNVNLYIAKQWTLEWCLYKSSLLSELFKEAVSIVHSKTDEFKKNKDGNFKDDFEAKLITKLKKSDSTSPLDKVAVAGELAELISKKEPSLDEADEYIKYLIDAIKYVCRVASNDK